MTERSTDHFVLMYHHVAPLTQLGGLAPFIVSPAAFTSQLDAIEGQGLEVVALHDILENGAGPNGNGGPRVVITFDDCPKALLDFAVPELERRGWKATFFAVAGKVGGYNDWDVSAGLPQLPLMSWEDIRTLSALGHEVGAHGFSHVSLRRCRRSEARLELLRARETLEQGVGKSVRSLAYPYGDVPDGYRELCGEAGYASSCSIFSMSSRAALDRFDIRRILVSERDTGLRMRMKLSRIYLRLRGLAVDRTVLRKNGTQPRLAAPAR